MARLHCSPPGVKKKRSGDVTAAGQPREKPAAAGASAGSRRQRARRAAPRRSTPSSSSPNSPASSSTWPCPAAGCVGRWKVPRSSRLYRSKYPVRSQTNSLIRFRRRLRNTKRCPVSGSARMRLRVAAASPSKPRRRSTASAATSMRTDAGSVSMASPRRARPGPAADPRPGTPGGPAPDGPRRGGFRSRPRSRRPSSPGARDGSALAPACRRQFASPTRRSAGIPPRGAARTRPAIRHWPARPRPPPAPRPRANTGGPPPPRGPSPSPSASPLSPVLGRREHRARWCLAKTWKGRTLTDQARLLADLPLAVLREELDLLGCLRARQQGSQARVIRAQELGQHPGIKRIILRPSLPKPIPGPVQRLGIHRIDHDAMVEQEIHHPALGPLNGRPELESLRSPLVQLPAPLAQALRRVRHGACGDLRAALIRDPHRVGLIRPVDTEIVVHGPLLLRRVCALLRRGPGRDPGAVNGGFALYRSSRGPLSLEPRMPFSCRPGQSSGEPPGARRGVVL